VLRLHEAADGWLARVRLPGGRLAPEALDAIGGVAALGSGVVELTSRASIQIRGLPRESGDAAASCLQVAGLMPSLAHDRVRNILASPVAGRHPDSLTSTDDVVAELDRGLCADPGLAELPGRFLFAIVDGSSALGPHRADVSLEAALLAGEVAFRLHVAGTSTTLTATPGEASGLALAGARGFLDLARADGVDAWGVSALRDGPRRLARHLGGDLAPDSVAPNPMPLDPVPPDLALDSVSPNPMPLDPVPPDLALDSVSPNPVPLDPAPPGPAAVTGGPLPVGSLTQADGRVAVTALPPLGRLDGRALRGLAECSRRSRGEVRIAPRRTVSLIDLPAAAAQSVMGELSSLGLVISPESGWSGLSACAGKGACAKARVDVRRAAQQRAAVRDGNAPIEHWSGCERRCGEPVDVGIRFVAGGRA
jgi:sulfite reductase beta subunit-like hemoprotein